MRTCDELSSWSDFLIVTICREEEMFEKKYEDLQLPTSRLVRRRRHLGRVYEQVLNTFNGDHEKDIVVHWSIITKESLWPIISCQLLSQGKEDCKQEARSPEEKPFRWGGNHQHLMRPLWTFLRSFLFRCLKIENIFCWEYISTQCKRTLV